MKKLPKPPRILLAIVSVLLILCIAFLLLGVYYNNALTISSFSIKSDKIPDSFRGFRIAQVSDLHNAEFGKDNTRLLDMLTEADPDIILLTGDMIDCYRTDTQVAIDFAEKAAEIAPCYYVTGNHESRVPADFQVLAEGLENAGVTLLSNECTELRANPEGEESILLMGIDDPDFAYESYFIADEAVLERNLAVTLPENSADKFTVLLSHRPEMFDIYCQYNVNLVFSGHAHGGQFRLPFIGGLYAPGQGLLPEYDSGLYTDADTNLLVSRGIGNSLFPFRLFNKPEIILAELTN